MSSATRVKIYFLLLSAILLIGVPFLNTCAFATGAEERVDYSDAPPVPTGNLRVTRPTLTWHVAPQNGRRVTSVRMQLNGARVAAEYDAAQQSLFFTPTTALKAGSYAVHCRVTIDRDFDLDRDWTFTIIPGAVDVLTEPTTEQAHVCAEINAVRGAMNLPALTVDSRLCAAAGGHVAYMVQNHTVSHGQATELPGYVAETAEERVGAYGFGGSCYESVSQGTAGAPAVRKLFDAPYHRAPFLQPGTFEVGSGTQSDIVTLLFGVTRDTAVVTYPYDGQKNVPTNWNGVESPNPLRLHRAPGVCDDTTASPSGYPITLFSFGPDSTRIKVGTATLTTADGHSVPVFVNTPDNDEYLQNGVLLIPQQPLRPGATYRVAVQATDAAGHDCSRTWTFTTLVIVSPPHAAPAAHAAPAGKQLLATTRH